MILNELAQELRTTIYVLMEYAPDDITGDMNGTEEIPADVVDMIRESWKADDGVNIG